MKERTVSSAVSHDKRAQEVLRVIDNWLRDAWRMGLFADSNLQCIAEALRAVERETLEKAATICDRKAALYGEGDRDWYAGIELRDAGIMIRDLIKNGETTS